MTAPARRFDVIANQVPEPPYPADVRARGWKFELDIERIDQSDTWLLAPRDMRPWLLMLWMKSWTQAPCGTLPADDALIAARIDMDPRMFAANREILLRGWYRCSDGRLYHPIITELVEAMRDSRTAERNKKARQRAEKNQGDGADVPGDIPGTPAVLPVESTGSPPTGTGTGTGPGTGTGTGKRKPARKRPGDAAAPLGLDFLEGQGVEKQVAADWLTVRKQKNLPLTLTAWEGVLAEAAKARLSGPLAVKTAVLNSWGGFKAKWLEDPDAKRLSAVEPAANWWDTPAGIRGKGVELGLPEWSEAAQIRGDVKDWPHYRASVFRAAGPGPWAPGAGGASVMVAVGQVLKPVTA